MGERSMQTYLGTEIIRLADKKVQIEKKAEWTAKSDYTTLCYKRAEKR